MYGYVEASNLLQSLYYGGWVAPNIYYLGYAGVINVNGVKIGGVSGIYDRKHYHYPHYESYPYTPETLRSVYHVRELEIFRLAQYTNKNVLRNGSSNASGSNMVARSPMDIFLSHDWPQNIWNYGDLDYLLKCKPYFREDICSGKLGNPPLMYLLKQLKPRYWFAAHLHMKFMALVTHVAGVNSAHNESCSITDSNGHPTVVPSKRKSDAIDKEIGSECMDGKAMDHRVDIPPSKASINHKYATLFHDEHAVSTISNNEPSDSMKQLKDSFLMKYDLNSYYGEVGGNSIKSGDDTTTGVDTSTTPVLCGEISSKGTPVSSVDGEFMLPPLENNLTRFLALDKVHAATRNKHGSVGRNSSSNRDSYIQFIDIPLNKHSLKTVSTNNTNNDTNTNSVILSYDLEWLAIIRKTHHLLASHHQKQSQERSLAPGSSSFGHPRYIDKIYMPTTCDLVNDVDIQYIQNRFDALRGGDLTIPPLSCNPDDLNSRVSSGESNTASIEIGNVQTDRLLELLELPHIWTEPHGKREIPVAVRGPMQARSRGSFQGNSYYQDQTQYQRGVQSRIPFQSRPPPPPPIPAAPNPSEIPIPVSMLDDNEISIDDV